LSHEFNLEVLDHSFVPGPDFRSLFAALPSDLRPHADLPDHLHEFLRVESPPDLGVATPLLSAESSVRRSQVQPPNVVIDIEYLLVQAWSIRIIWANLSGLRINVSPCYQQLRDAAARLVSLLIWHNSDLDRDTCPNPSSPGIASPGANASLAHAIAKDGAKRRDADHHRIVSIMRPLKVDVRRSVSFVIGHFSHNPRAGSERNLKVPWGQ
jgi:hypothetical protein